MCGLAGIVGPGAERLVSRVAAMNAVQRHRGPDGEEIYTEPGVALGHVRLVILDPSDAARQPMRSSDGRYTLVFNGEIYNFIELREELGGRFRSSGDTEVLLAAWARWGAACLDRIKGMFAFAVWDAERRDLTLVRDRFGIKPLYYARHEGCVVFASEIKALLAAGLPARPDLDTVARYLCHGLYDDGDATFFDGVRRLPAGCRLIVSIAGETGEPVRYYDLPGRLRSLELDFPEARDRYAAVLHRTVEQHLRSDMPVGAMVSGGLDSSVVMACALRAGETSRELRAFTVDYPDPRYSERPWVEDLVSALGVTTEFCRVDSRDCLDALPSMVWHQEEPFGGVPTVAWFAVYARARALGIPVLLDGNGADECLAGYWPETLAWLDHLRGRLSPQELRREIKAAAQHWGCEEDDLLRALGTAATDNGAARAIDGTLAVCVDVVRMKYRVHPPVSPSDPFAGAALRGRLYDRLVRSKLPRALRFADKASMAFSCELRVPFLDHELVELAYSLPESFLIRNGMSKAILREAARGLIPERIRTAAKRSVQSPQREWLRRGPLADRLAEVLSDPSDLLRECLDIAAARDALRAFVAGRGDNANFLWQWLNLDAWYRCFVLGERADGDWPAPRIESMTPTAPAART